MVSGEDKNQLEKSFDNILSLDELSGNEEESDNDFDFESLDDDENEESNNDSDDIDSIFNDDSDDIIEDNSEESEEDEEDSVDDILGDTDDDIEYTDESDEDSDKDNDENIFDDGEAENISDTSETNTEISNSINNLESEGSEEENKRAVGSKIVDSSDIYNYNGDIVVMDKYGKAFDFKYIDIKNIIVTKDRIRQSKGIEALQKSIAATGLLMPLVVSHTITDGVYVLINGFRRLIACAKLGITEVPCVINTKITTKEMRVLEALYNHYTPYTVQEIVDFINYLENERGIVNQSTVEYLAQMEPGDYPKLKDLLNDNDPDIVGPMFNGEMNIEAAYRKLLSKRKKQSHEEKELEKAEKMYGDSGDSETIVDDGISADIQGKGEEVDEGARQLTDEEIESLGLVEKDIDNLDDSTVEELMQQGNDIDGFDKAKVQSSDNREYIDPLLRKAIINRDGGKCRCCGNAGVVELDNRLNMAWADLLDVHHIHPVFSSKVLGEKAGDTEDNLITVCLNCHRSIHLWGYGDLHVNLLSEDEVAKLNETDKILYNKELERLKKVIKLGNVIRDTMRIVGIQKEKAKKEYSIKNIGRELPKGNKETNGDI